jgi:hypothetical protein
MTPWNNSTKQELAKKYEILITAIIKYKNETSVTLAKEIGLALLVLLVFVLISYLKVVSLDRF